MSNDTYSGLNFSSRYMFKNEYQFILIVPIPNDNRYALINNQQVLVYKPLYGLI